MSLGKLSGIDYSLNTKKSSIENFEQIEEQKKYDNIFSTNNYDATFEASTEEDLANKILDLVAKKSNKKVQEEQSNPYELGFSSGKIRLIDVNNVSDPINPESSAPSTNSCPSEQIQEYKDNIENTNGQIDDFKQGQRGDCYFLAAIDSIKRTDNGQEILNQNIQQNDDGSITVTLPGAVNARNQYIQNGKEDKCSITGTYVITPEALEKAKDMSGQSYAYGDIEVIALELAMESFRAEVLQTNEDLGQKSDSRTAGQIAPESSSDTLAGGLTYDAVYILTGCKSDAYIAPKRKQDNIKLYIPGEYGYITEQTEPTLGGLFHKDKGISEIEHAYYKDSDLQKMLDKYKGNENEYSITVSFVVGQDGPDGTTKAGGGHALTVKKITDDYVEVVNPWDTTKSELIPRGDFEAMTTKLNVAAISEDNQEHVSEKKEGFFDKILNFFHKLNPFSRK